MKESSTLDVPKQDEPYNEVRASVTKVDDDISLLTEADSSHVTEDDVKAKIEAIQKSQRLAEEKAILIASLEDVRLRVEKDARSMAEEGAILMLAQEEQRVKEENDARLKAEEEAKRLMATIHDQALQEIRQEQEQEQLQLTREASSSAFSDSDSLSFTFMRREVDLGITPGDVSMIPKDTRRQIEEEVRRDLEVTALPPDDGDSWSTKQRPLRLHLQSRRRSLEYLSRSEDFSENDDDDLEGELSRLGLAVNLLHEEMESIHFSPLTERSRKRFVISNSDIQDTDQDETNPTGDVQPSQNNAKKRPLSNMYKLLMFFNPKLSADVENNQQELSRNLGAPPPPPPATLSDSGRESLTATELENDDDNDNHNDNHDKMEDNEEKKPSSKFASNFWAPGIRKISLEEEKERQKELVKEKLRELDLGLEDALESEKKTQQYLIQETIEAKKHRDREMAREKASADGNSSWFGSLSDLGFGRSKSDFNNSTNDFTSPGNGGRTSSHQDIAPPIPEEEAAMEKGGENNIENTNDKAQQTQNINNNNGDDYSDTNHHNNNMFVAENTQDAAAVDNMKNLGGASKELKQAHSQSASTRNQVGVIQGE